MAIGDGSVQTIDQWGIHRNLTRLEHYLLLWAFMMLVDGFGARYSGRIAYLGDILFLLLAVVILNYCRYRQEDT